MRSFTAIVAFTSLAFATVASALPSGSASFIEPPPEAAPYLTGRENVNFAVGTGKEDIAAGKRSLFGDELAYPTIQPRGDGPPQGIPDVITALNDKILPLCHDLSEKVATASSPDDALKCSIEVLGQVKELLVTAKGEIEKLVANPVESIFYLNGKILDSQAIAQILAVLTVSVTTALGFVIKTCASVQTDDLVGLVTEIAGILAAIITLLVKVIATIITDLIPLIHCALDIIKDLKLTALMEVLKIAGNA